MEKERVVKYFVIFYPELYRIFGGSTPDYRGMFLRGVGGNSAGMGQEQGDAIRNITGSIVIEARSVMYPSGVFYTGGNSSVTGVRTINDAPGWTYFDASRVVPTANENRPVNKAVRYLIKAL